MVDTAFERGYQRYSDFEKESDYDKAVAIAYTQTMKRWRAVEMDEQMRQAQPKGNK